MFCHTEFLQTFAVKVLNLVKKKTRKKLQINKQKETKTNSNTFSTFSVLAMDFFFFFFLNLYLHFYCRYICSICSPAPPEGIKWEHHQPNEIIIDWPTTYNMTNILTCPLDPVKTRKPKALQHFQGVTKPEDQQEKIKTIKDLLQAKKRNKLK